MLISETLALRQPSPARAGPPHPGVGPGSLLPRLAPSGGDASVIEQSTIRLPKFVLPGPWEPGRKVIIDQFSRFVVSDRGSPGVKAGDVVPVGACGDLAIAVRVPAAPE